MLSTERIKEAENNFKTYLKDELIKKEQFKDIVFVIHI